MTVLFLDYDGCLHADDVYLIDGVPTMRRPGAQIFEHANLLAKILTPYPDVQIVLSTSWVGTFNLVRAKLYLPQTLQQRVVGTTYAYRTDKEAWAELSRFEQIIRYVRAQNLQAWLALDDDDTGWPEPYKQNLVCPAPRFGIGEPRVQLVLAEKLAKMSRGAERVDVNQLTGSSSADRPRLLRSRGCQRDALLAKSSLLTGLSCAFDAAYLCFVEVAESRGIDVANLEHPSHTVISLSSMVLRLIDGDIEVALRLGSWCQQSRSVDSAPCNLERALTLAQQVYIRTVALLDAEVVRPSNPYQT
ncbi:hypothetical protein LMG7141_03795 [Ralstonia condita]|uniref:FCP1 homology domain-containing protein n=1 Tax=Ralstonia condita TaxID=3058600 RepID=A0ABM9JPJ1_9RALS|nr:HAD domain-containing protein [Ralstonia sp. LMG 7141]CAJ0800244.1 hypothetical protein LMG7141_03795 [Ralstonia sp. LMG 7141]